MKTIFLPTTLDEITILGCIRQAVAHNWLPIDDIIIFDFSNLSNGFVKPTGVTAFANLIKWLQKHGCIIRFAGFNELGQALAYLDNSLFFEKYLGRKLHPLAQCKGTTIPLKEVDTADRHRWIENELFVWLNKRLALDIDKHMPEFKVCMDEIFNNINDHSGVQIGCSFAQHYPRKDLVEIAISDFGIGIPSQVRKILGPEVSAKDALLQAVEEGFSTQSLPSNRGSGLDTLIQNIVNSNNGTVTIMSHDGLLLAAPSNQGIDYSTRTINYIYPGTLLKIILKTDTIPDTPYQEEEFLWDF